MKPKLGITKAQARSPKKMAYSITEAIFKTSGRRADRMQHLIGSYWDNSEKPAGGLCFEAMFDIIHDYLKEAKRKLK